MPPADTPAAGATAAEPAAAETPAPLVPRSRGLLAAVALVGIVLDQVTKWAAVTYLDPAHPPRYLGGFLTLQLVRNPGAAFSLGGDKITVVFTILAIAALTACFVWLVPRVRGRLWSVIAGLFIAGIAGNLIDRLVRPPGFFVGHVVDFVQLPNFAIFNVADMCLTCSAVAVVLLVLFGSRDYDGSPRRRNPDSGDQATA